MATAPSSTGELALLEPAYPALAPEDRPRVDHLVTEDDTPVDNIYSEKQQRLLPASLYDSWHGPGTGGAFIALANVGLFYGINIPPHVPDVLVSLDVTLPADIWEKGHRSYMLWEYGKPPDVVIEVVSNTIGGEASTKLQSYARIGIPYYVIYDPQQQLSERTLVVYEKQATGYVARSDFFLPGLELGLMLWQGRFEDREDTWLRWCTLDGAMLLTGHERAEQERLRAEQAEHNAEQAQQRVTQAQQQATQARLRAEQAEQRAARLAARLRALGIEPDA